MEKRKFNAIAAGVSVLVLLIVALLMANSLRRSSRIVLPDAAQSSVSSAGSAQPADSTAEQIAVTPQTVQTAIATLARPENYSRYLTVESIWSGGSSSLQVTAIVSGDWVRTDARQDGGSVRHVITNGSETYIWYNSSRTYYEGRSGDISADDEQHIPTYEDLLNLDVSQIAKADYRTFSEEDCLYAETAPDENGFTQRYWVSVGSGLLIGAEKLQNGETIYRMAAQPVLETAPASADFTLPDGRCLHSIS